MKRKRFLRNSLIVMSSSLLFQIIGICFRVYMSSKVGTEVLGLYHIIMSVYMFLLSLSASGISLATTRLITDFEAEKKFSKVKPTMLVSFAFSLSLSILLSVLLFFSSEFIAGSILGDTRAGLPLKILSLSFPFVAVSSCCRGYFYAKRQVLKTVGEQLVEQLSEIIIFASVIGFMLPKGAEYACYAIVIGTVSAEIISAVFSFCLYKKEINKHKFRQSRATGVLTKLLKIAFPVSANACLRSGLLMVENILVPRGLTKSGLSYEKALAEYGLINGMVLPVISFPGALLVSFSMLLIPEISEAHIKGQRQRIRYISSKVFFICFVFSAMISGIFFFFGEELSCVLYGTNEAGVYISLLAPLVTLTYLDSIVDAILKGLNDQTMYLTFNFIDSVIRVILTVVCLPIMGIKGVILVIFASEIINSTLSILRLIKLISLKVEIVKWFIKPYISIIASCFIVSHIKISLSNATLDCCLKIIFSIALYVLFLFISKAVKSGEVKKISVMLKEIGDKEVA